MKFLISSEIYSTNSGDFSALPWMLDGGMCLRNGLSLWRTKLNRKSYQLWEVGSGLLCLPFGGETFV